MTTAPEESRSAASERREDGAQNGDPAATPDEPDPVEEAGRESFPTSDPPSWTLGVEEDDAASDDNE